MAIVVSCIADDLEGLERLAQRQVPLADLVELRLDRVGHPGREALAGLFAGLGKPALVTCRSRALGGGFAGSVDEELALLRDAAEAGARFVDVDWRLSLELGEVAPPCHRIVSRHADDTPEDLDAFAEEVRDVLYEGDVTKLVPFAHRCADGLRFLRWLRGTRGHVGFCAGEAGRFTRVLAPIFGSPFTYCSPAPLAAPRGGLAVGPAPEATAQGQIPVNDFLALAPPGGIQQETAIFAVVGRPVGHSLSPRVHGMTLKAARLDAVYVALEPDSLEELLALADDENYRGFSVTAPFKGDAFRLAAQADEASQRTRAANTLVRERGRWRAANTDVAAVRDALSRALAYHRERTDAGPARLADATVLVLGTGGAARAAAWAVRSVEGRAKVAGRDHAAARALAEELGCEALPWERIPDEEWDALVHATPVGSRAAGPRDPALPVPAEWIRPGSLVLDAVYRPIRTALLVAAVERGCTPVPGGEWFVRQASAQFRLFTGAEPDDALLRASFEHALDEAVTPAGAEGSAAGG